MSCLENMGRTLGRASIRVILILPAISGYHCIEASDERVSSALSFKRWQDEQVTHVGEILSEEIVELSSVLDSSGSSTDNNERKETVNLLLTLTGKVGRLDA